MKADAETRKKAKIAVRRAKKTAMPPAPQRLAGQAHQSQIKDEPRPQLIAFEITRRCRYQCKHCRAHAGPDVGDELDTEQCKKIITSISQFARPILILTGGEPMERADLYEIITHAREKGLRVVMATCGYLLNEETMQKLKEAGVAALAFSIDGSSAETHDKFRGCDGAFDTVMRAIATAKGAKMPFQINTTLSKLNAGEILGIADVAKKSGAICFDAFMMVPTGRGEEISDAVLDPVQYESLLGELVRLKMRGDIKIRVTCGPAWARVCEQAKAWGLTGKSSGCMGGRGFGFVSWRGDVQTCGFLEVSAGNLVENGFKFREIWLNSKFLKEIRDLSAYKDKCGECEYVGICGGCRARAMAMLGDYLAGDPVCGYMPGAKRWKSRS